MISISTTRITASGGCVVKATDNIVLTMWKSNNSVLVIGHRRYWFEWKNLKTNCNTINAYPTYGFPELTGQLIISRVRCCCPIKWHCIAWWTVNNTSQWENDGQRQQGVKWTGGKAILQLCHTKLLVLYGKVGPEQSGAVMVIKFKKRNSCKYVEFFYIQCVINGTITCFIFASCRCEESPILVCTQDLLWLHYFISNLIHERVYGNGQLKEERHGTGSLCKTASLYRFYLFWDINFCSKTFNGE